MPVDPVFADNRSSLLGKLRMSSDIEDASASVIDESLLQVRTQIYQHLGADRVASIKTANYSETAGTDAEILRLSAAQIELYGCKAKLLRDAPVFFLEAKNKADEAWNDDDLLRNAMGDEDWIAYYDDLFLQGLDALLEDGVIDTTSIKFKTVSPSHSGQKILGQSVHNGKGLGGLYP